MAEAAAMELACGSSGLVGNGYQLVKSGTRMIPKWVDRARGLMLLMKLPKGPPEASVFGEDDVTPELLAALSLGGAPGLQLSTIALLKAIKQGDQAFLSEDEADEVGGSSLMDGNDHEFQWLDGRSKTMRIHLSGDKHSSALEMRLGGSGATVSNLVVVAFHFPRDAARGESGGLTRGLVVRSQGDGVHYYCENQFGELKLSDIDVPNSFGNASGSSMVLVSPRVLSEYSCFRRLHTFLAQGVRSVVELLGIQKVAKELGEKFAAQCTGDGISLLSKQHLRNVHNNPRRCTPILKMPTDEELRTRVEEATSQLPLRDRDAGLVLFPTMQKIISGFVETIKSEAAKDGNVGVRPYEKEGDSNLIRSCIVQASGMDATFAIFDGFRKNKLNIAVSPGCTAVYFPGLSLTVAFPEGHQVLSRTMVLRPACPFTTDLKESLHILLGLAPKLAKNTFTQFAKILSSEFAKDPALALSPITGEVVRALSPGGRPCDRFYLTDLYGHLKKRNPKSTWGEASVAGVLCQLCMTFSVPPSREGGEVEDCRCFFQVCREVWPSTCLGAELVVDCGVDISGCNVREFHLMKEQRGAFFLRAVDPVSEVNYELTGVPWDKLNELRECVGFLHHSTEDPFPGCDPDDVKVRRVRIPVPCHVIGFGTPPTVAPTVAPKVRSRQGWFW